MFLYLHRQQDHVGQSCILKQAHFLIFEFIHWAAPRFKLTGFDHWEAICVAPIDIDVDLPLNSLCILLDCLTNPVLCTPVVLLTVAHQSLEISNARTCSQLRPCTEKIYRKTGWIQRWSIFLPPFYPVSTMTSFWDSPLSLYAIPAAWVLAYIPQAYKVRRHSISCVVRSKPFTRFLF